MPKRMEHTQKTVETIQYNERILTELQHEIDNLTNINSDYNAIYAKYVKSLENSNFKETTQHALELDKKHTEVNELKDSLKANWNLMHTTKDKDGNFHKGYYKFDEE